RPRAVEDRRGRRQCADDRAATGAYDRHSSFDLRAHRARRELPVRERVLRFLDGELVGGALSARPAIEEHAADLGQDHRRVVGLRNAGSAGSTTTSVTIATTGISIARRRNAAPSSVWIR